MNMFRKAERSQAKLRLSIMGPAGSGKTKSALLIAKGLVGDKRIALIDTERGSGDLYSDLFNYDVATLSPPFSPQQYLDAIHGAERAGYDVCIIDSLTHAWAGEGGLLDMHDAATKATRNSFTAWKEITPVHNKLVNAMVQSPIHIIATVRTKTAYEVQDVGGKKIPVKLGLSPVFRDGIEYEFTTVFDLSVEGHVATVSKDRTGLFDSNHFVPTIDTGILFSKWLLSATPIKEQATSELKSEPTNTDQSNEQWYETLWKEFSVVPMAKELWTSFAKESGITGSTKNATVPQQAKLTAHVNKYLARYREVSTE